MKMTALLVLLLASTSFASGPDDTITELVSTSSRSVEMGGSYNLSCSDYTQSDGSKIFVAILKLDGQGPLRESVTLSAYALKNCDAVNEAGQKPIELSFAIYNQTPIDLQGNIVGETYRSCTVQGLLQNGFLLSAWYWLPRDISSCQ